MTALKLARSAEPPGTIESFDDFFRREHPRAAKLAWLLTRSPSDADEIAQEAMVSVHARFAELDSPAAYLTRVVVNPVPSLARERSDPTSAGSDARRNG